MRPEYLTLLAIVLYGSQNFFLEGFLGKGINIATFQMWFNGFLFIFATAVAIIYGAVATLSPLQIGITAGLAAIFFIADTCIFFAYAGKGSAFMVGTMTCAMPIIIGVAKFCVDKKWPMPSEIIGMVLVTIGVMLFLKK